MDDARDFLCGLPLSRQCENRARLRRAPLNRRCRHLVDGVDIVGFRRQVPLIEGSTSIGVHIISALGLPRNHNHLSGETGSRQIVRRRMSAER